MKRLSWLLIGVSVVSVGIGLWQQKRAGRSSAQAAALERKIHETQAKTRELARKQEALARSPAGPSRGEDLSVGQVLSGVDALRAILASFPRQRIPELQLLKDEDWILVAAKLPVDPTQEQLRDALKDLQLKAKEAFVVLGEKALTDYMAKSDGKIPTDVMALEPYFDGGVSDELLRGYHLVGPSTDFPRSRNYREPIEAKESSVEGEWDDTVVSFGAQGSGSRALHPTVAPSGKRAE